MADSKIKISSDSLNIEIEGTSELIYKIFTDLKDGRFLPPPEPAAQTEPEPAQLNLISTDRQAADNTRKIDVLPQDNIKPVRPATTHMPDLNELILERRRFTQTEWMILLAWFTSHKGKFTFTKKDINKPYMKTSKYTGMKHNQLKSNLISLILNDCIVCVEKGTYLMTDTGIKRAISLLSAEASYQQHERKLNFAI